VIDSILHRLCGYAAVVAFGLSLSAPCFAEDKGYVPPDGFVPTPQVAAQIAEAILVPIYGRDNITEEKPFKIHLEGDVWIVQGTLPQPTTGRITMGGVFMIKISRQTGEILDLIHTR
jgi:hypothetical protein